MKCSYHPASESQDFCSICSKPLCRECSHQIKAKTYCQDCLVRGAEWSAAVKELRIPADSPRRAACCAVIPGMGAVYNNEYTKAITYFCVFAALILMGDQIQGIFGFGAFAFLIFTMFDAYRTAEAQTRARLESPSQPGLPAQDRTVIAWGIFLIVLGILFLLQNIIHYYFLNRLWPLVFIGLGIYLVFYALQNDGRKKSTPVANKISQPVIVEEPGPLGKKEL